MNGGFIVFFIVDVVVEDTTEDGKIDDDPVVSAVDWAVKGVVVDIGVVFSDGIIVRGGVIPDHKGCYVVFVDVIVHNDVGTHAVALVTAPLGQYFYLTVILL